MEGFTEQSLDFIYDKDMASISIQYQNKEPQTATITAEFENDELTEIHLEKPNQNSLYLPYILAILSIVIIAYYLNRKLKSKKTQPKTEHYKI